ncbi:MAG: hypothetical protein HQL97_08435 [Magnetococcales bacterium]|nr:hypothetical protein [Magnetococcales bacterium]
MNSEWQESGLHFDFTKAKSVISLDNHGKGHGMTKIMKSVDFVVEWDDEFWLIEVKNPENPDIAPERQDMAKRDFFEKIQSKSLIFSELFPKLIDSILFLGFDRGIPFKPMRYMALIGLSILEPAHFITLRDALEAHYDGCLKGPKDGWSKNFSVHLFNLELWNEKLPQCQVTRVREGTD